jgi:phosphoglycerate dehydrogenase-like enzyme
MKRLKVLFLPQPGNDPRWQEEVVKAVAPQHDLTIFDPNRPISEQFAGIEAVLDTGGSVGTRALYDAAREARLWQILGTGLDHVDIAYMKTKGFAIANCPGLFSAVALAECAMMYILMLSRRFAETQVNFQAGRLHVPVGMELVGKVLGLIGFGASAQELARRAKGFGMRIHAVDVRAIEPEIVNELAPEFLGTPADTDRVIQKCDFLSVHLHLTPGTRHIIDARRISLLRPDAFVINVARGALIDETALHDALLNGRLAGAGLDVFSTEPPDPNLPVFQLPNVIVTPHTSGSTDGTARKRAGVALDNLDRIARGVELLYRVDV